MSRFTPDIKPESLENKVIVLTGGANGIGASAVELCCQNGAYVCFGDVADAAGRELEEKLRAAFPSSSRPRTVFCHTDVSEYKSVVSLFDTALDTYGRIDHVIAGAAIQEMGNWFDPNLTMDDVREPASDKVLDINLRGVLYVARIASVYLRQNRPENADRSMVLISSIAGFKESPGLFVYQAAKHGVLGLMRSLRLYLPYQAHRLRVNTVCPWMTDTVLTKGIRDAWIKAGMPVNKPMDVAKITVGLMVDPQLNGTSIFVEGGRGWEIEANIDRLEPQWLGEEPSRTLAIGQKVLGSGDGWTK